MNEKKTANFEVREEERRWHVAVTGDGGCSTMQRESGGTKPVTKNVTISETGKRSSGE